MAWRTSSMVSRAASRAFSQPSLMILRTNSGCCSYFNGDCTGIEIADGEIRLVRWSTELDDPSDRVLEAEDLQGVFAGLTT